MAFVVVDVDGYRGANMEFRAREAALCYYLDGETWSETMYFYDERDQWPVSAKDNWFVYKKLTGLAFWDWRLRTRTPCYPSRQCILRVVSRLRDFAASIHPMPLLVMAKGGDELRWIHDCDPRLPLYDLGEAGCPKVEELCLHRGRDDNCGNHKPVTQRFPAITKWTTSALHCPKLETEMFMDWWLNWGAPVSLVSKFLPISRAFDLIGEFLYGRYQKLLRNQ